MKSREPLKCMCEGILEFCQPWSYRRWECPEWALPSVPEQYFRALSGIAPSLRSTIKWAEVVSMILKKEKLFSRKNKDSRTLIPRIFAVSMSLLLTCVISAKAWMFGLERFVSIHWIRKMAECTFQWNFENVENCLIEFWNLWDLNFSCMSQTNRMLFCGVQRVKQRRATDILIVRFENGNFGES